MLPISAAMTIKSSCSLALVGILGIAGCGVSEFSTPYEALDEALDEASSAVLAAPAPSTTTAACLACQLPVLAAGAHVGTWISYEALPSPLPAVVAARLAEARGVGLSVGRIHVSWAELEPAPGVFDLSSLRDGLAALTAQGLAAHVLLETVDSDGLELPADLVDRSVPGDNYRLVGNRRLDDPMILARFNALLANALPVLAAHRVFAISVANEPDNFYDDHSPSTERGISWGKALLGFLGNARARIRAVLPRVAVAMTVTQGSIDKGYGAAVARLTAAGDVAIFNYYCQDLSFTVRPAWQVPSQLDQILATASGRKVVFQELGCPAGLTPSVIGASASAQAGFYQAVFSALPARPAIRAAFAFQLVDWSPELAAMVAEAQRRAGYPELAAILEETLRTIGLVGYRDGVARPAWAVWLRAVDTLH